VVITPFADAQGRRRTGASSAHEGAAGAQARLDDGRRFLPLVAFDQSIFLKSVLRGVRGLKKSAEILSDSFKLFEV